MSSSEIKLAVTLSNIVGPAGNSTFGLPTPAEQQAKYEAVLGSVNAGGGVACRKLVAQYYSVNPADQSDMHQKCLDIVQAGKFAVVDDGGEYAGADCFGQNRVAFFGENLLFERTATQFYPYLFSPFGFYDAAYKNMIFALRDRGTFDKAKGFQKLGFMYFNCVPEVIDKMNGWFHNAGIAAADVVSYNAGCPSPPLANPSDLGQAILKFKTSGVTHVTFAYFTGGIGNFTTIAQQQNFHPKYVIADDGYIGVSGGTGKPDASNFDGAVAIAGTRYGEENTPGVVPSPGTATCNGIMHNAGLAPLYQQPLPGNGGWICNLIWMVKAAIDHAPTLSRESLAPGLLTTKSIEFSYPGGPNDLSTTRGSAGGQSWRAVQYVGACSCWKLAEANFHPGYR